MKIGTLDIEAKHEHDFRRTVLIVDDEEVNLRIISKIIEDEYDTILARSGEEALGIIREKKDFLSLILLDLYMSGMHGHEVIDVLQEDEELKKIPVIVHNGSREGHRGLSGRVGLRSGSVDGVCVESEC